MGYGKWKRKKELKDHDGWGWGDGPVALSPDGKMLVFGRDGRSGMMNIWDIESDEVRQAKIAACSLAFSPDDKMLACGPYGHGWVDNRWIIFWDLSHLDSKSEKITPVGAVNAGNCYYKVNTMAFSPNGKMLAANWRRGDEKWKKNIGEIALWKLYDRDVLKILDRSEYYLRPSQLFLLYLLSESTGENNLATMDDQFKKNHNSNRPELLYIKTSYENLPEKLKPLVKACFHVMES